MLYSELTSQPRTTHWSKNKTENTLAHEWRRFSTLDADEGRASDVGIWKVRYEDHKSKLPGGEMREIQGNGRVFQETNMN